MDEGEGAVLAVEHGGETGVGVLGRGLHVLILPVLLFHYRPSITYITYVSTYTSNPCLDRPRLLNHPQDVRVLLPVQGYQCCLMLRLEVLNHRMTSWGMTVWWHFCITSLRHAAALKRFLLYVIVEKNNKTNKQGKWLHDTRARTSLQHWFGRPLRGAYGFTWWGSNASLDHW